MSRHVAMSRHSDRCFLTTKQFLVVDYLGLIWGLVWGISPGHSTVVLWRYGVITSEVSERRELSGQHYLKGLSDTSVFYNEAR